MDGKKMNDRTWFARLGICCAAFLLVCGIVGTAYYLLGMEPFGVRSVAIDDAKIQYIDFFTYYVDVLRGVRALSYDFANMLGGSSIGLFSYYLASPFNLLLYFFGKEGVYRFFNVAVLLKLGTAGATFAWYLQRRFADRLRPVFVLALSMGYGAMQYSIAQSSNIMWLDGVYMLPLILLGVYETLHRKSVWRLVLAVAFCILCNWYIAGISCLFSGIWFLFEYAFCGGSVSRPGARRAGNASRLRLGFTDFVLSFCRYVWGMGLGVMASAVLFLPAVSAMRQGKGQYEEIKVVVEMAGDLLSSVRGYVIGARSERGFAALFCGGMVLFAAAALLASGVLKARQKAAYLGLLAVCFLMLHWEPAMLAFSLLKRADSYWYRYSYLVCFALLFGAAATLASAERERRRWLTWLALLGAALLYAAAVLKLNGIHLRDFRAQGLALVRENPAVFATAAGAVFLAVLTVLVLAASGRPSGDPALGEEAGQAGDAGGPAFLARLVAGLLLLAVTAGQLGANAWLFWRDHADNSQALYRAYSEGMQAQLARLRALDGGYYRIAQDRTRWHYDDDDLSAYFNDSLAQNYWSNAAYTSSPENAQLSLMWRLGYRDEAGCMLIVRDPILASDSFLGVKYLLQSTPIQGLERVEEVDAFNGRSVYRNPYALPFAFVYNGAKLPTRRYDNAYIYQNALFSTLSGRRAQIYEPLAFTRRNLGDKAYFAIYVPEEKNGAAKGGDAQTGDGAGNGAGGGGFLVYGNLLWEEKMGGLVSVNGAAPFGYCRWMSPASFLIRSRQEQAQSEAADSLQAAAARQKALEEAAETGREGVSDMAPEKGAEGGLEKSGEKGLEVVPDMAAEEASEKDPETAPEEAQAAEEAPIQIRKKDLAEAAAAFDEKAVAAFRAQGGAESGFSDVRTVVFSTEKGLTFKDYQFYGLDLDALAEASARIRTGAVAEEDLLVENGHVACTVAAGRRGSSLCLLVPWSKGWEVTRNGEEVSPDTVAGTMMTIPLVDGENTIELRYQIPYLREGSYISLAALALLLADILWRFWGEGKKRRRAAQKP